MGDLGIAFHWKENVTACDAPTGPGDVTLRLSSGATPTADTVLVAAGRTSNTETLGLDAAGVTLGERGLIPVDAQYRTNVPGIYAVGDVIGAPALAATGVEQARVAMSHAFDLGFKSEVSPILPYGIYTIPEVSMAGETEESLREKKIDYVAGKALYGENARGQIIGDRNGFLKLLFRRDDMKLLGIHVIGEQASELIHVGLAALLMDAGWDLFNRICFNYPTPDCACLPPKHILLTDEAAGRGQGAVSALRPRGWPRARRPDESGIEDGGRAPGVDSALAAASVRIRELRGVGIPWRRLGRCRARRARGWRDDGGQPARVPGSNTPETRGGSVGRGS